MIRNARKRSEQTKVANENSVRNMLAGTRIQQIIVAVQLATLNRFPTINSQFPDHIYHPSNPKSISICLEHSDGTAVVRTYTLHCAPRLWGRSPKRAHICTRILVSG